MLTLDDNFLKKVVTKIIHRNVNELSRDFGCQCFEVVVREADLHFMFNSAESEV